MCAVEPPFFNKSIFKLPSFPECYMASETTRSNVLFRSSPVSQALVKTRTCHNGPYHTHTVEAIQNAGGAVAGAGNSRRPHGTGSSGLQRSRKQMITTMIKMIMLAMAVKSSNGEGNGHGTMMMMTTTTMMIMMLVLLMMMVMRMMIMVMTTRRWR